MNNIFLRLQFTRSPVIYKTITRMASSSSSSTGDLSGTYAYTALQTVRYGPGCISDLPMLMDRFSAKKALILTGNSLKNKTDVIKNIEKLLGDKHALSFSEIGQHAPVEGIEKALKAFTDSGADIIVSVGGGSPIDSAKVLSQFHKDKHNSYIKSIAVPTTLSAAEFTMNGGYTKDKKKTGVAGPELVPAAIILDAELTLSTPDKLWLSTGMRAVDHAVEALYRPYVPPPIKVLAYAAIVSFFKDLRASKANPKDVEVRQALQIAAWHSLFPYKQEADAKSALGLSHALGYMLGSPFSIPHGICSCITLGPVIRYKAKYASAGDKQNLAKLLPLLGETETKDLEKDVNKLADLIDELVKDLGLDTKMSEYKVKESDLDGVVAAGKMEEEDEKKDMIELLKVKM